MTNRLTRTTARLLLAFVLISIGYAIGKEVGVRSAAPEPEPSRARAQPMADAPAAARERLVVHYFHATIRCTTCNAIERMTHETLEAEFAEQIHDGDVQWRVQNFHENEALAGRYGVATSTVVLVRRRGDREIGFRRLDRVWELVRDPAEFATYIRDQVRDMIRKRDG